MTHHKGRPPVAESFSKSMHLRLTAAAEQYVTRLAEQWGVGRQDVVRRIIKRRMREEAAGALA